MCVFPKGAIKTFKIAADILDISGSTPESKKGFKNVKIIPPPITDFWALYYALPCN